MVELPSFTTPDGDWRPGHRRHCGVWIDWLNYDCSCGETERRARIVRMILALNAEKGDSANG